MDIIQDLPPRDPVKTLKAFLDRDPPAQLGDFIGNLLTPEEKEYRTLSLETEIKEGEVDKYFIPYLRKINSFDFIVTTACCTGHVGGHLKKKAHFSFRSSLSLEKVVDLLLRPMEDKFDTEIQLMTECRRLRYILWLDRRRWRKEVEYFISLLEGISLRSRPHKEN